MDAKQIIEKANCTYIGSVKKGDTVLHRFHPRHPGAKTLSIYEAALLLEGVTAIEKLITLFGAHVE